MFDKEVTLKPLVGFSGYYAGNDGKIYSTLRRCGSKPAIRDGKRPTALVPLVLKTSGYFAVNLHVGEIQKTYLVHELVATAFHGKRPHGLVCCHGNGNRQDNLPTNLRWDTRKANEADKVLHGTGMQGIRHHQAKLTEDQVQEIRSAPGKQRDIAARFGISQAQVWNIKNDQQWKHLKARSAN